MRSIGDYAEVARCRWLGGFGNCDGAFDKLFGYDTSPSEGSMEAGLSDGTRGRQLKARKSQRRKIESWRFMQPCSGNCLKQKWSR